MTMPMAIYILRVDVPPALKNGSGTPITGMTFRTIPIFIKQWVKIIEDTPIHRNIPCRSFARSPFASVRRQRKTITNTTAIAPTKPSVCPI